MVHSQLLLTSEEQGKNIIVTILGVLSIISNNKKEKMKKNIAALIIQKLFRLFIFKYVRIPGLTKKRYLTVIFLSEDIHNLNRPAFFPIH